MLNIDQIQENIPFGIVNYFEIIDSTNSWLVKNARCGDICISEKQTNGRGRRGNQWVSPKTGNIYLSLCWCFEKIPKHWTLLGLVVGVAIAEVLSDIGLCNHGIKWPNDIYWKYKKMGGILIETTEKTGKVVIGVGLNVNMPSEFNVSINQEITSLGEAMPEETYSRELLIMKLVSKIHQHLDTFGLLEFDEFMDSWKVWDILRDEIVNFEYQGAVIVGKVVGIDRYGRLGVQIKTGDVEYFSSAEIKIGGSGCGSAAY